MSACLCIVALMRFCICGCALVFACLGGATLVCVDCSGYRCGFLVVGCYCLLLLYCLVWCFINSVGSYGSFN